ncbi:hypothetical protein FRB99_000012 [Tulasnella sp. 403]|nr:hypothetical protein FRB99_000012 [Tulasnella sp. 403]
MPHLPLLIPHFYTKDLKATIEFYTTKLGFTHVPEANPEFDNDHAILYMGGPTQMTSLAHIMFYAFPTKFNPTAEFSTGDFTIKLDEGEEKGKVVVDEWVEKWSKAGVEVVMPAEDRPWKIRSAILKDNNGHAIMPFYCLHD